MTTLNLKNIGAHGITRRLIANGTDRMTFTVSAPDALTSAPVANPGEFVTLTYPPHVSFFGRVARVTPTGSDAAEAQNVEVHGLWASLQQITYLQSWTVWDPANQAAINATRPRVILGMGANGQRVSTGAQIADAIAWAASRGLPIQTGTIDAGIALPFDEQENISCADVILAMLRILPDYVAWFEGPVFHCRRRANLQTVSLPIGHLAHVQHSARTDLQIPGVIVNYEVTHDDDGRARTTVITDTAGNTSHWAAARILYDLQGRSRSNSTAEIITRDIPENLASDKDWLRQFHPWLETVADEDLTITAASRIPTDPPPDPPPESPPPPLPRMLVKGPIPDWLNKTTQTQQITWVIDYTVRIAGVLVETITGLTLTANIVATDALTRTYSRLAALDTGEPVPEGIASALYAAWGTLWHEGRVTRITAEIPGTYRPGQTLQVNGISSPIQEVVEDLDNGTTTLTFGPPANIQADTLIALFRGLRARRFSYSRADRLSGLPETPADALTGRTPDTRPTSGAGQTKRLRLLHPGPPAHEIDLNPEDTQFDGTPEPTVLKTREVYLIQSDGSAGLEIVRAQVLCSATYGDPIPLRLLPPGGQEGDILAILSGDPAWEPTGDCDE